MSFIHVRSLLHSAVARAGIGEQARAAMIIKAAQSLLEKNFSNALANSSPRVVTLSHGVLTISCSSSSQAAAIRLREQEFLLILEERFGHGVIESFRFIS